MGRGIGGLATSLTIWAATFAWLVGEWRRTAPGAPPTRGRACWTVGALCALVHAALAFHVHYGWSHAVALADTAARTAEVMGRSSGGGLFVNYVFLGLWAADALWWRLSPRSFAARPRWADGAIRAFLWFLFLNGAFVFARSPQRWVGLLAVLAVPAAWYRARGSRP